MSDTDPPVPSDGPTPTPPPASTHKVTSEWMETHVQKAPAAKDFVSVDMPRGPAVIFTDTSGRLFLLVPGRQSGLFDLAEALGISNGTRVISLDAALSADGTLLYLAIAIPDRIILTAGILEEDLCSADVWAKSKVTSDHIDKAFSVRLGEIIAGYPTAILQTQATPDIPVSVARLTWKPIGSDKKDHTNDKLELRWVKLPFLPDPGATVLSCSGKLKREGFGMYLTYISDKQRYLTFVPDKEDRFGYAVCPTCDVQPDVTSLKPLQRTDGLTDLLLAGPLGLFRYTSEQFDRPDANSRKGTIVLNGRIDHVHPALGSVSTRADVWAVVNETELGYLRVEATEVIGRMQSGKWTPVRSGPYSRIRPSISADSRLRRLCTLDDDGHLVMLERSDTGVWTEHTVNLPAVESVDVVPAYVTTLRFYGRSAMNKTIRLTSTGSATYTINHEAVVVDGAGVDVTTGPNGAIEIKNISTGLTTPQLRFQEYGYGPATIKSTNPNAIPTREIDRTVLGALTTIDVSAAVRERLHAMPTDPAELKKLQTITPGQSAGNRTSQPLFDSSADLHALGENLTALKAHTSTLKTDGSSSDIEAHVDHPKLQWDHLHFLSTLKQQTKSFFIEAGHLMVKIAGEIKAFAIECIEHALKAFHVVLEACGAAWHKLIGYLGWVFNWSDIVVQKENIKTVVLYGLEAMGTTADKLFDKIESVLDDSKTSPPALTGAEPEESMKKHGDDKDHAQAETAIKNTGKDTPANDTGNGTGANGHANGDDHSTNGTSDNENAGKQNHPAVDYIMSHLKHLLTGDDGHSNLDSGFKDSLDAIDKVMNDNADIVAQAGSIFSTLLPTFQAMAKQELHSLHDIMTAFMASPLVVGIFNLLHDVVKKILRPLATHFVKLVSATITAPIQVPFFAALYKFATGKSSNITMPSMLDIMCFIIAVPATVLIKIGSIRNPVQISEIKRETLHEMVTAPEPQKNTRRNESGTSGSNDGGAGTGGSGNNYTESYHTNSNESGGAGSGTGGSNGTNGANGTGTTGTGTGTSTTPTAQAEGFGFYFNIPPKGSDSAVRKVYIDLYLSQPFVNAIVDSVAQALDTWKAIDVTGLTEKSKAYKGWSTVVRVIGMITSFTLARKEDLTLTTALWARQAAYAIDCIGGIAEIAARFKESCKTLGEWISWIINMFVGTIFRGIWAVLDFNSPPPKDFTKQSQVDEMHIMEVLRFPELIVATLGKIVFAIGENEKDPAGYKERLVALGTGTVLYELGVGVSVARGILLLDLPEYGLSSPF